MKFNVKVNFAADSSHSETDVITTSSKGKEGDELSYTVFGHSLWSANQLPAQGVEKEERRGDKLITKRHKCVVCRKHNGRRETQYERKERDVGLPISPASGSYNETAHTLRFAQRVQSVVNRPVVNEDPVARIIRELRAEVARLRHSPGYLFIIVIDSPLPRLWLGSRSNADKRDRTNCCSHVQKVVYLYMRKLYALYT
ncbi:hypothetical protein E2986_11916 [Frieseomelitta varia]|uniref:Kinesin motor domain-containing protein n=1 Tax=Frieseomelitta varia TaxID=561572 RepID=A0A833SBY5_9HYME|nr:hypothetical protein E2986_11916 [Frieseomelitta varia]